MLEPPELIPTSSLRLENVPTPKAKREVLNAFALTFNPHESSGYDASDLNSASASSAIVELRSHLYVEQRRWNHFGREPDVATDKRLREIVGLIRLKLGGSV